MKKEILILILIFIFFPIINADVISINSGGNNEIIINPNQYIEGFFNNGSCTPHTCSSLGYNCGSWNNGCGGTLNCGTCASGYTCSSGTCTVIPTERGGGGTSIKKEFTDIKAIPQNFHLSSAINQTMTLKIDLSNIGNTIVDIQTTTTSSLEKIIFFLNAKSFTLNPKEIKTLNFKVHSPPKAGIYTGKIIFSSREKKLEIPFILNVRSGFSLFDISLDIPEKDRIIKTGEKLKGQINLIQAGVQKQVDVSMHYIVKDYNDNVYIEESETIMVYKQKNYEHEFNTENLLPGNYIIGGEVIYEGGVATASYPFTVIDKQLNKNQITYIVLAILLIIAIISMIIIIKHYKQLKLKYNKKRRK